jgi:phosphosulfolactate phosphohydrolase-like enzyme
MYPLIIYLFIFYTDFTNSNSNIGGSLTGDTITITTSNSTAAVLNTAEGGYQQVMD